MDAISSISGLNATKKESRNLRIFTFFFNLVNLSKIPNFLNDQRVGPDIFSTQKLIKGRKKVT